MANTMNAKAVRTDKLTSTIIANQPLTKTRPASWIGNVRISGNQERLSAPAAISMITAGQRERSRSRYPCASSDAVPSNRLGELSSV